MNYLFFDIECANCYNGKCKIYSFGYLKTDEDFNIIEEPKDILMNPVANFDPYVKKNILVYDRKLLKTMPKFDERYQFIKSLMEDENTICSGYGIVQNDMRFLSDECKRYKLPPISAKCLDVQKLIKVVENKLPKKLGVEFAERFGEQSERAHKSDTDAVRAMIIAREICKTCGKKMQDFLD